MLDIACLFAATHPPPPSPSVARRGVKEKIAVVGVRVFLPMNGSMYCILFSPTPSSQPALRCSTPER